jgi:cysteine-S-conjugate beta-lyase
MKKPKKRDTLLAHAGSDPARDFGVVNPPVYHASTVAFPTVEAQRIARETPRSFTYGRHGSPTSFAFEDAVSALEGGDRTFSVGSGLAAIAGAMLAFVQQGDHVLVCDSAYRPTRNLCEGFLKRFGVATTYYDPMIGEDGIAQLIRPETKVIYVESPGSHTFEVQDVPAIVRAAHRRGVKVVMDNTWSAGMFFKPFDHGVDVSMQAATKYFVGHSDAMLGTISCTAACIDDIYKSISVLGYNVAPDDAYLGLRGLRTLAVRIKRHEANALKLAEWFASRPDVERVLHPAFPSCPGHDIWKRDFTGSSGLFSVVFKRASPAAIAALVARLELFALGGSWGGFESLILPTHVDRSAVPFPGEDRCVRFHVGLENPDDLIEDLTEGLAAFNSKL